MKVSRTLAIALAALVVSAGLAGVVTATDERNRTTEHGPNGEVVDRALDALAERYDLTDGQVEELERLIADVRADGVSVTERRNAVREKLVEFGVPESELPAVDRSDRRTIDRPDRAGGDGRVAWLIDYLDLTDEQVAELREVVREARDDGAYPAEVRVAVLEQLRAYGYADAELVEARDAYRVHRLDERFDLTDEQVARIEGTIAELRETGAMEVEVRAAVLGELQAFGVIPEEYPRDGRDDHRHRHAGHGHVHSYPHGHGDGNAHENGWSPADATA
jgi:hypothetical protein